jgi:myo-inositol-1(or 4)-monophosphatase
MNTSALLKTAISAALEAGKIIRSNFGKVHRTFYKENNPVNLVTETDKRSEEKILRILRKQFPDHRIVAEESNPCDGEGLCHGTSFVGATGRSTQFCWYVDPLDGTSNFDHGYPFCCTSIAVAQGENVLVGVVYDPIADELFHAEKGKGAYLNKKRIRVSKISDLKKAFMGTGFPYDRTERADQYMIAFKNFVKYALGVRRDGAAALDLAYAAMGRFDGFWELKLHAWDVAAGTLLIQEAGGKLSDFKGRSHSLFNHTVVTSNGILHKKILDVLALPH